MMSSRPGRSGPLLALLLAGILPAPRTADARDPLPSPEEIAALPPDGGPRWNRLVFEKSPYLRQHAGNPVDWYPWGDEAFEKARAEDKPVFLSIGYSTCHWCHVMEHESFEDPAVAALLNDGFVAVKVDREERPDVDQVYMTFANAMGSRGGWPLTLVMTADRIPFFVGTYFPKTERGGRTGMLQLLPRLRTAWETQRDEIVLSTGRTLSAGSLRAGKTDPGTFPGVEVLDSTFRQLAGRFDETNGGFGGATKFPIPHNLQFLLRYAARTGSAEALAMVEKTLIRMRRGGIWDHLGMGFHRYSTDAVWLVPHFEKMLYDQALLSMTYVEAWQVTGNEEFARTARGIFTYVLRDMTAPGGGFYSAEDADSEGEEGKFYLWTPAQVEEVLGREEARLFDRVYDIGEPGNFRDPHSGKRASIPHLARPVADAAAELGQSPEKLARRLAESRQRLFEAREKRVHPFKDDKILTDWNGLMIAALAQGARALDEPEYADAARRAADFVLRELRTPDGRLHKRFRDGDAGLAATLEDYAFFVWGLVELYETVLDPTYLEEAVGLAHDMITHFRDADGGAFFLTADDGEPLPFRAKESYDGAIPSGNSVAALALVKLARLTGDPAFESEAAGVVESYAGTLARSGSAHTLMLGALDFLIGPSHEVVVVGEPGSADVQAMLHALNRPFLPNKVVLFRPDGDAGARVSAVAPFASEQVSLNREATAYVCRDFACRAPTTDIREMLSSLSPDSW